MRGVVNGCNETLLSDAVTVNSTDDKFTASVYENAGAINGYPTGKIEVKYYDSTPTLLSTDTIWSGTPTTPSDNWAQRSDTTEPPATTATCKINLNYVHATSGVILWDDVSLKARPRFNDDGTSDLFAYDRTVQNRIKCAVKRESSGNYDNITCYLKIAFYDSGDSLLATQTLLTDPTSSTVWGTFSATVGADTVHADTTQAKIVCEVQGYYDAYSATAAGHGYGFDKIEVQAATGETSNNISFDFDQSVCPSWTDFMNSCYVSGFEHNLKIQAGQTVQYLPATPSGSRFNIYNHDRVWFAGDPESKSTIYYTEFTSGGQFDPDYVDIYNSMECATDDGQNITGLGVAAGNVLAFKDHSIFKLTGQDTASWNMRQVSREIGCCSHHTIVTIDNVCYWFGGPQQGVFSFDGTDFSLLSSKITDRIREVVNPENSFALFYKDRYYLFVESRDATTPYNDTVYVLSLINGSWSVYKGLHARTGYIRDMGAGQTQMITGTSEDEGYVYQQDIGQLDDNSTAIDAYITTADFPFRGQAVESRIRKVIVFHRSETDDADLTISYASDKNYDVTDVTMDLDATGSNLWGVGEWGTARWEGAQTLSHTFVPTAAHAEAANFFRLKYRLNSASALMNLYGFSVLDRERRVRG